MPKRTKRGGGLVVTDATIRQTLSEYARQGRLYEISDWDVSQVTDMSKLFMGRATFNADLSQWDVSNVTTMKHMFYGCPTFDGEGLGDWGEKTSKVTDMSFMFARCALFEEDISSWNVAKVTDMQSMFQGCIQFSRDLKWDTVSVTNMRAMFANCEFFDGDITTWNVEKVTDMSYMFEDCENFNQDLKQWDTIRVTNMKGMFEGCKLFNQDLSMWELTNVDEDDMKDMFKGCKLDDDKYPPKYLALAEPLDDPPVDDTRTVFLFNRQNVDAFARGLPPDILRPDIQLLCNDEILQHLNFGELLKQSEACCAGEISEAYKVKSFFETLQGPTKDKFQLLSAFHTSTKKLVGFIVAELGECKALQDVWSVRLICVNNQNKKISSTVLLGALLYAIKDVGGQFAVLELASAYTNIQGFVSYSKLGFIKNLSLYNYTPQGTCFTAASNLPMYVSLKNIPDIRELVANRKVVRLTPEQDDTGLYEKYLQKTKIIRPELADWNAEYRSKIKKIPMNIVLTDQVYTIEDRVRGGTRRKRKKKCTRKR
jgi:surface protein